MLSNWRTCVVFDLPVANAPSQRYASEQVVSFFSFSQPVRRAIFSNIAMESVNSAVLRAGQTPGHFQNDRAATKLIYLALCGGQRKWRAAPLFWHQVRLEFQSASPNGSWWRHRDWAWRFPAPAHRPLVMTRPAPVDRPRKSLRTAFRRRASTGASGLGAVSPRRTATVTKYGRSDCIRPGWSIQVIPSTTLRARHPHVRRYLGLLLRRATRGLYSSTVRDRRRTGQRAAPGSGLGQHDPGQHQAFCTRQLSLRELQTPTAIRRRVLLSVQPQVFATRDVSPPCFFRLADSAHAQPSPQAG